MLHFSFAYRYLKAKKSANAINIISWVSVVAIALGTAALVIIMSVFNGFEDMVKALYGTFYTDIRISSNNSKYLVVSAEQLHNIGSLQGVKKTATVIEERAILQNDKEQSIVSLKGVDEKYGELTGLPASMIKGKFDIGTADEPQLVLGAGIELALRLDAVKAVVPVTVYLPKQSSTVNLGQEDLAISNLLPSGTFAIQDEFNNKYVFTNIRFLQQQIGLKEGMYSAIEVALKKGTDEKKIQQQLQELLGSTVKVETRFQQNKVLYSAMQLEKWFIYGVLTLIMIIFSFTIISSLSMLVIEKQKDISVLKSMGAGAAFIRKVFLSEGFLLSGIGAVFGLLIGLSVCWLQIRYHFIKLAGSSFLIDYYPVKILPFDLTVIVLTVVLITFIASWLPANKAAARVIELRGSE